MRPRGPRASGDPSDPRRQVGISGEQAVADWYVGEGYEVLDRNWRVREGEIDLVVERDGTIAFCEVKTRRSDRFGVPVEAITARKQQRLRLLVARWLDAHPYQSREKVRFDVASVVPGLDGAGWVVTVLMDAF
jgi:putative endonuclease